MNQGGKSTIRPNSGTEIKRSSFRDPFKEKRRRCLCWRPETMRPLDWSDRQISFNINRPDKSRLTTTNKWKQLCWPARGQFDRLRLNKRSATEIESRRLIEAAKFSECDRQIINKLIWGTLGAPHLRIDFLPATVKDNAKICFCTSPSFRVVVSSHSPCSELEMLLAMSIPLYSWSAIQWKPVYYSSKIKLYQCSSFLRGYSSKVGWPNRPDPYSPCRCAMVLGSSI